MAAQSDIVVDPSQVQSITVDPSEVSDYKEPSPWQKFTSTLGQGNLAQMGGAALDLAKLLTGDPGAAYRTGQFVTGMAKGLWNEPGRIVGELDAARNAKTGEELRQHLSRAMPLFGPQWDKVQHQIDQGAYAEATANFLDMLGQVAGPELAAQYGPAILRAGIRTTARAASESGAITSGLGEAGKTFLTKTAEKYLPGSTTALADIQKARAAAATARAAEAQRLAGRTPLWETPPPDMQAVPPDLPLQGPLAEPALPSGRVPGSIANVPPPAQPVAATPPVWAGMPERTAAPPASVEPVPATETLTGRRPGGIQNQQPITPRAAAESTGPSPELLDQVAKDLAGKKFAKLDANAQNIVRGVAEKLQRNAAPPEAAPPALAPAPAAAAPVPQAEYQPSMPEGATVADLIQQELAAKRAEAAAAPVPPETPAAGPQEPASAPEAPPAAPTRQQTVAELSDALNKALAEEPGPKRDFAAEARAKRADLAPQWADHFESKGYSADTVSKFIHREKWRLEGTDLDLPKSQTAVDKLRNAVVTEMRNRQASRMVPAPPPLQPSWFNPSAIQKLIDLQESGRVARPR